MRDLSKEFQEALAYKKDWSDDHVHQCLQFLQSTIEGSKVDWDDGEGWGCIFRPDDLIAYICTSAPLALVSKKYSEIFPRHSNNIKMTIIEFSDPNDPSYSVNPEILNSVFNTEVTPNIDYNNTSINDIWYATI